MTILAIGRSTTVQVQVGQMLRFAASNGAGTVVAIGNDGQPGAVSNVSGVVARFGPYDTIRTFAVNATAGELVFEVTTDYDDSLVSLFNGMLEPDKAAARMALAAEAERKARLRRLIARATIANASDMAAMASPPTIGISATATGGLATTINCISAPGINLISAFGGIKTIGQSAYLQALSASVPSGGNAGNGSNTARYTPGSRLSFRTDASNFDLVVCGFSISRYRILVDGQYANKTSTLAASSDGINYLNVNFGSRKMRRIDLETNAIGGLFQIKLTPGDTIQAISTADRYRIGVIGDSITAAAGAAFPGDGYAFHAARRLGNLDIDIVPIAVAGTGYTGPAANTKFASRLDDLLFQTYDEVWFVGSSNDQGAAGATITAEALACFQGACSRLPAAPIIVFGSFIGGGTAAGATASLAVETAVKSAFDTFADVNSAFVPFNLANPLLQTGTTLAPTTGNYQYYLSGGDTTHPIDAGHDYIGSYVAEARKAISL